jgi:hypothetical protein
MRKILLSLMIFIAAFSITDRVFSYIFSNQIFSKTLSGESGGSLNYLLKRKSNVDFLILGSSRAKHQIDPALLTDVYNGNGYNAGINGVGTIVYNSVLLDILITNEVIPKVVILQTDKYQFGDSGEKIGNEIVPLYPFLGQSTLLNSYLSHAERFKLLIHAYRYNGKFLNILFNYFKRNSVADNTGYVGLNGEMNPANLLQSAPAINQKFAISDVKIKALRSIVTLCNQNNIKLIVVFPPVYNNVSFDREGNNRLFAALNQEGVSNLIDFANINDIPMLKPASFWKDVDHLNKNGAAIFSQKLNQTIKTML